MRRRARWPVGFLFVLLASVSAATALPGTPVASDAPWVAWQRHEVETNWTSAGGENFVALDSGGRPHLFATSMSDAGDELFYYAPTVPGSWTRELVDRRGTSMGIALDASDRVHLAYRPIDANTYLTYATRTDTGWVREPVDQGVGWSGLILVGPDGTVHILYQNPDAVAPDVFAHAWRDPTSGRWSIEPIASGPSAGGGSDARLDSQGRIHAVFNTHDDPYYGSTYYARQTSSGWATELVDLHCGSEVALELDSADRPHVLCQHNARGLHLYTKNADGVWVKEPIVTEWFRGFSPDIAIDSRDRPHVTFFDAGNIWWPEDPTRPGHMQYAVRLAPGEWAFETPNRIGFWNGYGSTIELDQNDRPHIAAVTNRGHSAFPSQTPLNRPGPLIYMTPASTLLDPTPWLPAGPASGLTR